MPAGAPVRRDCFFAVFLLASSFGVYAQTTVSSRSDGRITGTVTGQTGLPIAGANVMAVKTLNQSLNNPPSAKSDSNGQFEISGLPLRNYHVYASKPQDGYPMADPAYSEENQAAIALSPDRPSGSVIISIRKAGIITLDVIDKIKQPASGSVDGTNFRCGKDGRHKGKLAIRDLFIPRQTRYSKFQLLDTKHGFIPMRQIARGPCHCGWSPASKNP